MPRLLFEKTGRAIWISHLDLMRLFQRAFKRAGLSLTHTQGFNPRPSVSIALPMSVGMQSRCELLDFDLDGDGISCEDIQDRLNSVLIEGVKVLRVYPAGSKLRDLSLLRCQIVMEYDGGVPEGASEAIQHLFEQKTLIVPKKTKTDVIEQDIIPMIRQIRLIADEANTLKLDAVVCCQNPSLNPAQLTAAIGLYLPGYKPDFSKYIRLEIYNSQMKVFR